VAKLIGSLCDTLIIHPNVVNASDINEMPSNTLYVEGSILDRFLRGEIYLKPVLQNKILVVVNRPVHIDTINAVSAARATIGADISILELNEPLKMTATMLRGCASGIVDGWEELVAQVSEYDFDALAVATAIDVDEETAINYLKNGGINPWGGVEAKASKFIATAIDKPTAHSPFGDSIPDFNSIVDPRMAAEMVSITYLHSVLKGLHRSPQITYYQSKFSVDDIDYLITPAGCVGEPHKACIDAKITIIAVKENKTCLNDQMPDEFILVENYLEAAGIISCMKSGIHRDSVRRPLKYTKILASKKGNICKQ
jgi:hypothetical protein